MISPTLTEELREELDKLAPEQQRQVLACARQLSRPAGVPGEVVLRFAGLIPPDDLALMEQAIEEDCERIDPDEW